MGVLFTCVSNQQCTVHCLPVAACCCQHAWRVLRCLALAPPLCSFQLYPTHLESRCYACITTHALHYPQVDWDARVVTLAIRDAKGGGVAVGDDGVPQKLSLSLDTCLPV
jgi:hypothetical protein